MAEGWLHKGLAKLPHSSCPKLSSAVVFKCNTLLPSPLEVEMKYSVGCADSITLNLLSSRGALSPPSPGEMTWQS